MCERSVFSTLTIGRECKYRLLFLMNDDCLDYCNTALSTVYRTKPLILIGAYAVYILQAIYGLTKSLTVLSFMTYPYVAAGRDC